MELQRNPELSEGRSAPQGRRPWLLLIVLAVLLTIALAGGWQRNLDALRTQALCLSGGDSALLTRLPAGQAASWFRAHQARCQGDLPGELAAWDEVVVAEPGRVPIVRALQPGNIELAQTAVQAHPQNAAAQFWLGKLLGERSQITAAIQGYQAGLRSEPDDAQAWYELGLLLEAQADLPAATQAYNQACYRLDPGKNGCPNAGRLYLQAGEYELAAERYRQSIRQLPDWIPARLGLAQALVGLGRIEQAQRTLRPLAQKGNLEARQLLAELETP